MKTRGVAGHRNWWLAGVALILLVCGYWWVHQQAQAAELVRTEPRGLVKNPDMLALATRLARPAYAAHCASCHGDRLQGDRARGVPALNDADWLYGNAIVDLEQIIYYGIRSGHPKARNIATMPALGRTGQINAADTQDVIDYLYQIGGKPHDMEAAARGRKVYYGKGNCYDCHGGDADGVITYGTPSLLGRSWQYGGDRDALFHSIYSGRHGLCPAWNDKMTPAQSRALAVALHQGSIIDRGK